MPVNVSCPNCDDEFEYELGKQRDGSLSVAIGDIMEDTNKLTEIVARYELRVDEYTDAVEKFLTEYKHQCKFCFRDKVEGADYCADHSPYLSPDSKTKPIKVGRIRI